MYTIPTTQLKCISAGTHQLVLHIEAPTNTAAGLGMTSFITRFLTGGMQTDIGIYQTLGTLSTLYLYFPDVHLGTIEYS